MCDIDDTLTWRGRLVPAAFDAMALARAAGLRVIPITGRPAGWADLIARQWPVDGVVGENGGLWFWTDGERMHRRYVQDAAARRRNRSALDRAAEAILRAVPGAALASDQPYRELDLAIDFCEDVPRLPEEDVDRIVTEFQRIGATCKVSSIHVNGWFGDFDKYAGCAGLIHDVFGEDLHAERDRYVYFGDSANDEPMFERFELSIGVANVARFLPRMTAWPTWITSGEGGWGFAEGVAVLLRNLGADDPDLDQP